MSNKKNFTRNNFDSKFNNDYGESTNTREHKSTYKKSFFLFLFFVKNAQT
jgi:hypothetical protein